MRNHHVILPRLRWVTIATVYSWPGGAISLWPVPHANEFSIPAWKTAREAYELSRTKWVQMIWNGATDKRSYDVGTAEQIDFEPMWPEGLNFSKLLKIGFAGDKIIDSPENAYVLQLRGVAR
jgi:hypothetical protein